MFCESFWPHAPREWAGAAPKNIVIPDALFASIITTTPGTVSCVVDEPQGVIWVHALNGDDPVAMAKDMKQRYEAPLMRALGIPAEAGKEAA